jgi:hypothetical protein
MLFGHAAGLIHRSIADFGPGNGLAQMSLVSASRPAVVSRGRRCPTL